MTADQLPLFDPPSTPAAPGRTPSEPIVRSAEIEGNYRWTARRAWGAGPCIHWNLLNPADADALKDDPTMWRMMGFSYRWGFGSLVVTNLYPFISSSQEAMRTWRAGWGGSDWHSLVEADGRGWEADKSALNAWLRNMDIVRDVIRQTEVHVAAWGNGADDEDVKNFLDEVSWDYDVIGPPKYRLTVDDCGGSRVPIEWKCIGLTGSGAPTHPLARGQHRVPDDAQLQIWRKAA